jgi:pimeloyl-ACP methyl ester carboxylesterase
MKTRACLFCSALALALLAGCQTDDYAHRILEINTGQGKVAQDLAGTAEQMLRSKKIDAHRRVPAPDKAEMDVYVIKARDSAGQRLTGAGAATMLLLHGLRESKASHPYPDAADLLVRKGYDVVLIDLRVHGRSGGKYVTYGAIERHDVKAVMDALLKEGLVSDKIYVFGTTLGGSVAIQYAAIDPRCRGVMALTPFNDLPFAARWDRPLLTMSDADWDKVLRRAAEIGSFRLEDTSSAEAARKVHVPLVIVHGLIDLVVPFDNSQAIYDAANEPKKVLVVTPGPERLGLILLFQYWIVDKMDMLAKGKFQQVTTEPASRPSARP